MKRGTRVGQAYVALTVDGDGINEEIVSSVDEAGPDIEKAGDEHGERYGESFGDRLRRKLDEIRDKVADKLRSDLGDAGTDAGDDFSKNFGDGIDDDFLARVGDRLGENFSRRFLNSLESRLGGGQGANSPLGALFERLMADAEKSVSGNGGGSGGRDPFGDRIGSLLGAGSRNNALNLFGKSIGGIINLIQSGTQSVGAFFSAFSKGFSEAEEGASFLSKFGSGISAAVGEGLSSIAAGGPAAAAALMAVAVAMTLLVSVANALFAILVALASTVVSALVGALAVGAAGMLALAAAGGLAVLAFMSMTDAQKALLSSAFKPLHEEAIGLGQTILTDLIPAFDTWSRNLQVALALAKPLADIMGGALAQSGNILSAALSGPGIQMFIAALTQTVNGASLLDGILTHLASAGGGFINGFLALFAALLPEVLQFSEYLDRVATNFSSWATSAAGQNSIVDFVNRALGSLQSLWNLVTAVGGLIDEVLFSRSAQETGNNIFDSMADAVRRFTDYLSKDNRLENWFKEGETFAKALGDTIVTLGKALQDLNQAGVIDGIAAIAEAGADAYRWFSGLPQILQEVINPLQAVSDTIGKIASIISAVTGNGGGGEASTPTATNLNNLLSGTPLGQTVPTGPVGSTVPPLPNVSSDLLDQLQSSGADALAATSTTAGGYLPVPTPGALSAAQMAAYAALADSIIKNGPTYAAMIQKALNSTHKTIQNAITTSNKDFAKAIRDSATATDAASVTAAIQNLVEAQSATIKNTIQTLTTNASNLVATAQDAVNNAAESLKNATTKSAAKSALAALAIAQDQLAQAEAAQVKINNRTKRLKAMVAQANAIAAAQGVLNQNNANALAQGFLVVNATLADYADARSQIAAKLTVANQKLQDAVALRDNFKAAVTDAINSFAALTTAQAQTINGVQQALTSNDITTNLQTKLDQIKKFQANLHILLSQGLSQAAYKQLVDAGVDQGGAFAQALVNGGQGAVAQTNSLVSQIAGVADQLGLEASNRMYQAGVDAAQGLVDGLTSLSAQLDAAATALGEAIARSIANALGIHSPSTVMFDYMHMGVGDGLVNGLDAAHRKVGNAASRLSGQVAISPSLAAAYAEGRVPSRVSGNTGNDDDPRFRDLIVQTPTEDPLTVAREVLNEVVGRLP